MKAVKVTLLVYFLIINIGMTKSHYQGNLFKTEIKLFPKNPDEKQIKNEKELTQDVIKKHILNKTVLKKHDLLNQQNEPQIHSMVKQEDQGENSQNQMQVANQATSWKQRLIGNLSSVVIKVSILIILLIFI